ncbi:MAG: esterase family protein [Defluviitaleaceae bacterium]|nr:esterase family protein [Defluviitaleaceae bacterium]
MGHFTASIFSEALGFNTHLEILFPRGQAYAPAQKVLYLLHGLSDNCTAWLHKTRISEYANKNNYIVIMPEVQRSFYSDMAHGSKYFTYITRELPEICEKVFNLKHKRETTFVAGLSMGGFGAIKCGLGRPDFYAACASFSGALDMKTRVDGVKQTGENPFPELAAILGVNFDYPDDSDLFYLANAAVKLPVRPQVLITCGDGDFLLEDNLRFNAHMQAIDYGHTYKQWPGEHTWDFWEDCLPLAFNFFEGNCLSNKSGDAI